MPISLKKQNQIRRRGRNALRASKRQHISASKGQSVVDEYERNIATKRATTRHVNEQRSSVLPDVFLILLAAFIMFMIAYQAKWLPEFMY